MNNNRVLLFKTSLCVCSCSCSREALFPYSKNVIVNQSSFHKQEIHHSTLCKKWNITILACLWYQNNQRHTVHADKETMFSSFLQFSEKFNLSKHALQVLIGLQFYHKLSPSFPHLQQYLCCLWSCRQWSHSCLTSLWGTYCCNGRALTPFS